MSTWGQLRLSLRLTAPGIADDLLDEWLNARYSSVLDAYPWKGLDANAMLESVAAYSAGTVTATGGSTAVAGVGTTFVTGFTGYRIIFAGRRELYTFTYVSATSGTLDRVFEGVTTAGLGYTLFQNIYDLPADCKTVQSIESPETGLDLDEWSKKKIGQSIGFPCEFGCPEVYAISEDTPESRPPVLHTVEFYPIPNVTQGFPLRYQRAALGFDGSATGAAPLPWINDSLLLNGARADARLHIKDMAGFAAYEGKFKGDLAQAIDVDVRRRKQGAVRMDPMWTEYRRNRVSR
jgi:hypothetical protein